MFRDVGLTVILLGVMMAVIGRKSVRSSTEWRCRSVRDAEFGIRFFEKRPSFPHGLHEESLGFERIVKRVAGYSRIPV